MRRQHATFTVPTYAARAILNFSGPKLILSVSRVQSHPVSSPARRHPIRADLRSRVCLARSDPDRMRYPSRSYGWGLRALRPQGIGDDDTGAQYVPIGDGAGFRGIARIESPEQIAVFPS